MIAIPMKAIQELTFALPKCLICKPENGCSFIIDKQGNKVGDIHWQIPQITIYESYEYCDEVVEAIGKAKFSGPEEFKISKKPPVEDGKLNDYGEELYDKPSNLADKVLSTQDNAIT